MTDKEFLVYGKTPCSYCRSTVDLLTRKGEEFEYVDTHVHEVGLLVEAIESEFNIKPRTFPQIIRTFDGERTYIGGYNELVEYFNNKELDEVNFDD